MQCRQDNTCVQRRDTAAAREHADTNKSIHQQTMMHEALIYVFFQGRSRVHKVEAWWLLNPISCNLKAHVGLALAEKGQLQGVRRCVHSYNQHLRLTSGGRAMCLLHNLLNGEPSDVRSHTSWSESQSGRPVALERWACCGGPARKS